MGQPHFDDVASNSIIIFVQCFKEQTYILDIDFLILKYLKIYLI